jgi:DNA (cytosine-5)-methyltransferase 1
MRTAHLFAGAGGGILADLILGHEPVVAVEWDAYACAILREQFPGVRVIEGDVRTVDFAHELAGVDAICAGFPCQDISAAGKGAGIDGERSGLYREVMRAIDAVRPAWVFLENSPLIRTRGRHIVIADLVARGYSWRDGQLAAADVGAPHKRNRWWLLARRSAADSDGNNSQARSYIEGGRVEQGQAAAARGCAGLADADQIGRLRRAGALRAGGRAEPAHGCSDLANTPGERLEIPQPREASHEQPPIEGASGGIGWWSAEPGMGRMAHGVAHRAHRIKSIGNGQVPLQAAFAWISLGGPHEQV